MPIYTRRWDDPPQENEGRRILITRFRPRGVSKEQETWDEWIPDLGPSKELHARIYGKTGTAISWQSYRQLYLQEMRQQREKIAELAKRVADGESIALLCSSACTRESQCHRSLLRDLIEAELKRLSS